MRFSGRQAFVCLKVMDWIGESFGETLHPA